MAFYCCVGLGWICFEGVLVWGLMFAVLIVVCCCEVCFGLGWFDYLVSYLCAWLLCLIVWLLVCFTCMIWVF